MSCPGAAVGRPSRRTPWAARPSPAGEPSLPVCTPRSSSSQGSWPARGEETTALAAHATGSSIWVAYLDAGCGRILSCPAVWPDRPRAPYADREDRLWANRPDSDDEGDGPLVVLC